MTVSMSASMIDATTGSFGSAGDSRLDCATGGPMVVR